MSEETLPVTIEEIERLKAENYRLQRQNADLRDRRQWDEKLPPEVAAMVREKMEMGLPEEDAIAVAKRQAIHDAKLKEQATTEAQAKADAEAVEKAKPAKAK